MNGAGLGYVYYVKAYSKKKEVRYYQVASSEADAVKTFVKCEGK